MFEDGYGNELQIGCDVLLRAKVVSALSGDDPCVTIELYGTHHTATSKSQRQGVIRLKVPSSCLARIEVRRGESAEVKPIKKRVRKSA
jgi:hypothetical protein